MNFIEATYFDRCDVYRMEDVQQDNGSYKQQRVKVFEDLSCALSIGSRPVINSITENDYKQGDVANIVKTQDRLYLNPSYIIKQGDELIIRRYGREIKATAGNPFVYDSHQVLIVENISYA